MQWQDFFLFHFMLLRLSRGMDATDDGSPLIMSCQTTFSSQMGMKSWLEMYSGGVHFRWFEPFSGWCTVFKNRSKSLIWGQVNINKNSLKIDLVFWKYFLNFATIRFYEFYFVFRHTFSNVACFARIHEKWDFFSKHCSVDSFFEIACSLIGSIFTVYVVLCTLFHFRFLLIASTNGTPWRIKAKWTEIWSWKRRLLSKAENDGSESFVTLEFCIWNANYSTGNLKC